MGLLGLLLAPICHCLSLLNLLPPTGIATDGSYFLRLQRLLVPVSLLGFCLMTMSGNEQLGQLCGYDRHIFGLLLIFQQVDLGGFHMLHTS